MLDHPVYKIIYPYLSEFRGFVMQDPGAYHGLYVPVDETVTTYPLADPGGLRPGAVRCDAAQHAAHSTQHTANNTTARAHRPPCMVVNFQEPSRDLPHAIMCFLQVGVFAEQCPCLACWRGCGRARCAGEAAGGGDQGCTPCCCIWALQRLQAAAICRLAPARPPRRAVPA